MKRADIRTGVLYAYTESKYRPVVPVVVVDTGKWTKRGAGAERVTYASTDVLVAMAKVRRGAVGGDGKVGDLLTTPEKVAQAARAAERYVQDHDTVATRKPEQATVALTAVNPRFIIGDWDTYVTEQEVLASAKAMREAEAEAASQERVRAAQGRVEALRAHGVPDLPQVREGRSQGWRDGEVHYDQSLTRSLTLTWEQVDALLSLIPDGAVYEPPVVDEWEYAEPEGKDAAPVEAVDDETKAEQAEAAKPKRRTTGKTRFMTRTYGWTLSREQRDLLGMEMHQDAMLIALAPTKAAVEEMLIEVGVNPRSVEGITKGMRVRPLDDGWTTIQRWVEAGLATETSRGLYLVHEYHQDGPVVEITGETTGRLLGRFETKRSRVYSEPDKTIFRKAKS